DLPKLQFRKKEGKTQARWIADVEDFKMPVDIFIDGKEVRITPTDEWGDLKENIALNKIEVNDLEFYIKTSYKK
ncbi:MAG: M1 family peptidase, partial [Salegentibacter mishustinae]|nr:M1 family peptidase [Salegentibacter mishustinae]